MFSKRTHWTLFWRDQPSHRAIVAVDMENSTAKTDTTKAVLRRRLYEVFEAALHTAGIQGDFRDPLIDRGDGILALIHPIVPKTVLLNTVIPALHQQLILHRDLRLRAVVHAGEVLYDDRGCFGQSVDLSFRLLDAPALKNLHRQATAPLALVISDEIYRNVVRHGYPGIDDTSFSLLIRTHVAGQPHGGWVQMPDSVAQIPDQLAAGARGDGLTLRNN